VVYGTADRGCFPSHARELFDAVPHGRKALTPVPGGSHYLDGQPEEARRMVEVLVSWAADQRAAA
jgi:fermentation-respiration switch protein FrsA (DUF1100 family)